jgi:branched-chain amino acid aminotransferase
MASGRLVYMNGALLPEAEARISIFDSALMFGDMVFEMTRSFNGTQFKLREHLERLWMGMKILRIPCPLSIEQMESVCHEVVEANAPAFLPTDEHRLMINVSRGPLAIYESVFGGRLEPTVIVADFPLKWTVRGMGDLFELGINAVIPSQRAIPGDLLDPKIKNRSRLHYQMANIETAQFQGERNWALLLDPRGLVAEGTGDNFFVVKDGRILTPAGRNILRGISRAYIFELGHELGLDVSEADLEPYDVYSADEAFMTGTPFCLLPVTSLNNLPIGDSRPGPITARLLKEWGARVGVDIAAQIKDFNAETASVAGTTPYQF